MADAVDIAVIGGGPVGLALGLALQGAGLAATLIESRSIGVSDERPLALSHGSRLLLERLGAWHRIPQPTPITQIHVSQSGGCARVVLTAREVRLPALGYVVSYAALHRALHAALGEHALSQVHGARNVRLVPREGKSTIEFETRGARRLIEARLLVVADGGALANIAPARRRDYEQLAVVTRVASGRPHDGMAFERFTPHGPLALLPNGSDMAVVWTAPRARAEELLRLPDEAFCAELARAFGTRLGGFSTTHARSAFPLALRIGPRRVPGTVLVGNAAQSLHPVAGQGFNLGLRDAWELAAEIRRAGSAALGTRAMLAAFDARRRVDRAAGVGFTDSLVRLFSNDIAPLRAARGAGLGLLSLLPPAREFVIRRMIFGARG